MSIQRIFLTLILTVSYCAVSLPTSNTSTIDVNPKIDFAYTEINKATSQCAMFEERADDIEVIGAIYTIQGEHLAKFTSPKLDAIDLTKLDMARADPNTILAMTLARTIKSKQDLPHVVVLVELYIQDAHRGKGFAQQLINKVCQDAFQAGTKSIVLSPEPCEYNENSELKSLVGSPDYAEKKQRLMKLCQKCGFKADESNPLLLMYRNA